MCESRNAPWNPILYGIDERMIRLLIRLQGFAWMLARLEFGDFAGEDISADDSQRRARARHRRRSIRRISQTDNAIARPLLHLDLLHGPVVPVRRFLHRLQEPRHLPPYIRERAPDELLLCLAIAPRGLVPEGLLRNIRHMRRHSPNRAVRVGADGDDASAQAGVDVPPVVVGGYARDGPVRDVHAQFSHSDGVGGEALFAHGRPLSVGCDGEVERVLRAVAVFDFDGFIVVLED